jgi:hypothetical protein
LRLVELSNPALRQRRAIGRRLIGGLGRGSTVLLLRSRRAVLLRWRGTVLLRGRRTVLLGGSRRAVLLGRSAVSAVTVAAGVIVGLLRRIRLLRLLLLLLLVLVADTKVLELLGDLLEERHDGCDFEMRNTKSLERVRVMRGKGKRRGR